MNNEILTAVYRTKIVAFAERAMTVLEPGTKLETNRHHQAICHKLEQASQGHIKRLEPDHFKLTRSQHL